MTRITGSLVACAGCGCHFRAADTHCPHCGATVRRHQGVVERTAASMALGLAIAFVPTTLTGCDDPLPNETTGASSAESSSSDASSAESSSSDASSSASMAMTDVVSVAAAYGVSVTVGSGGGASGSSTGSGQGGAGGK